MFAAPRSRRGFLADVGQGMFTASLGWAMAVDMGLTSRAWAAGDDTPLDFGEHEALVALMQETPAEQLLPQLVRKLRTGTPLQTLLVAGVLSNARSFGGEDYVGFHTLMALGPSLAMSRELPTERAALPVLKVLYRNAARMQETGGRDHETLPTVPERLSDPSLTPTALREACRQIDLPLAERTLATLAASDAETAFNALLLEVADETEVHRVNLAYRAWDLLGVVGREHAVTMLRQSVRYCIKAERNHRDETRTTLARVFDQFQLDGRTPGDRRPDDDWLESMAMTFFSSTPAAAAEAAAAALAEGIAPDVLTEAAAIAANQLLLRDEGRPAKWSDERKPPGSVHGDSLGLHSCDAVNAWRNIARVCQPRQQMAAVILAAYQVARDRLAVGWGEDAFLSREPYPRPEHVEAVRDVSPQQLLAAADDAIRQKDQSRAAALIHRCGEAGISERAVFDLLLRYAISEDGALHAEKYYHTVSNEFSTQRPRFRWRQLTALARVTASEYGYPAPGYAEACGLLGLT